MRIFTGRQYDRPALKLWGAWDYKPGEPLLHPDYAPVAEKAAVLTDLFGGAGSAFDIYFGLNTGHVKIEDRQTADSDWVDRHITYDTPEGELHAVHRWSKSGKPGYEMEYPIKEARDLQSLLSVKYEPYPFDATGYFEADRVMGERGVVMFGLDHAGYALQRMMGSETLAYLSVDERELVRQALETFTDRVAAHTKAAVNNGIRGIFAWVGPELLIPPLLSDRDFNEFVCGYDKRVCDIIKNAGGYVWVHCHGKVARLLDRFIDMGVDVLNPLEPPKNGDIDLDLIAEKYRGKIGLEGNLEIQELLCGDGDSVREKIRGCVTAGAKSGRFILCPSAGYMEYPQPSKQYISNLLTYLDYGYECVNSVK
jgi:Uroporphyrinogen-III decarboxylase